MITGRICRGLVAKARFNGVVGKWAGTSRMYLLILLEISPSSALSFHVLSKATTRDALLVDTTH